MILNECDVQSVRDYACNLYLGWFVDLDIICCCLWVFWELLVKFVGYTYSKTLGSLSQSSMRSAGILWLFSWLQCPWQDLSYDSMVIKSFKGVAVWFQRLGFLVNPMFVLSSVKHMWYTLIMLWYGLPYWYDCVFWVLGVCRVFAGDILMFEWMGINRCDKIIYLVFLAAGASLSLLVYWLLIV